MRPNGPRLSVVGGGVMEHNNYHLGLYLQVVGQIVLLQGVSLEAMRCCVKVVITNAADKTFGLRTEGKKHV